MCDPMTLPGTFRKSTITDETTLGGGRSMVSGLKNGTGDLLTFKVRKGESAPCI